MLAGWYYTLITHCILCNQTGLQRIVVWYRTAFHCSFKLKMPLNENFSRQVHHLASKLVSSLTDFEVGSINHDSCIEFSLSNFLYHRFLTPNSDAISRQINGLVEKFFMHSQPEKSKCLKEVFEKFLKSDLSKVSFYKSSVHYSLISILLSLADNPLSVEYEKSPEIFPTDKKDDFDWTAYLLDGEDVPSNYHWDESPYNSENSDVETSNVRLKQEQSVTSFVDIDQEAPPIIATSNLIDSYWKTQAIVEKSVLRCSLDQPLLILENNANVTESTVIREVLWLLSGQENLFAFPKTNGSHTISQRIVMSHATNQALQENLKIYANCGDIVAKLRKFVGSFTLHVSTTYQAFASSLSLYLNWLMADLLAIEKKLKLQEETFLLQDLQQALEPHIKVLHLINDVYNSTIALDHIEESNVAKSSRLLGILYQTLQDESDMILSSKNPAIELTTLDVMFNLWLDSVKAYIDIIDNWISKGILEDANNEFVLFRKVTSCQQANFWQEAIVPSLEDIEKFCPWLSVFLTTVITGGKSMEILKILNAMAKRSDYKYGEVLSAVNEVLKQPVYDYFIDNLALKSQSRNEEVSASSAIVQSDQQDVLLGKNFTKLLTFFSHSSVSSKMDKHLVNTKPLFVLISDSLQPVIDLKCNFSNKRLVEVLKEHFDLLDAVNQFHNFHLMALGDVMHHFAINICEKLLTSDIILGDLVGVNTLMQEALSYNPTDHNVFVQLKQKTNEQKRDSCLTTTKSTDEKPSKHHSIDATDCIELQWKVEWPLTLVLTENCIKIYNRVFSYLMQIKRALYCIESLKFSSIYHTPIRAIMRQKRWHRSSDAEPMSASEKRHRMALLRARTLHLLRHWYGFVMTSVILAEKHVFSQKFAEARTLDDIITAHNVFLERILSLCLLDETKQASKLVQGTLKKIMTLTITFNTLWNCGVDLLQDRSLLKQEAAFHECSEFLGRILKAIADRGSVPILDSLAYAILS